MSDPPARSIVRFNYIAAVCSALYMRRRWIGRQERRRHRRERRQGFIRRQLVPRAWRRLQSLDLDRQGSSRHAEGRSLPLEDIGSDRRRSEHLMDKGTIKLEKVKTSNCPQAGMVRLVRKPLLSVRNIEVSMTCDPGVARAEPRCSAGRHRRFARRQWRRQIDHAEGDLGLLKTETAKSRARSCSMARAPTHRSRQDRAPRIFQVMEDAASFPT